MSRGLAWFQTIFKWPWGIDSGGGLCKGCCGVYPRLSRIPRLSLGVDKEH